MGLQERYQELLAKNLDSELNVAENYELKLIEAILFSYDDIADLANLQKACASIIDHASNDIHDIINSPHDCGPYNILDTTKH